MATAYRASSALLSTPTSYTVTVGDPLIIATPDGKSLPRPLLLQVDPGSGGTMTIEARAAADAAWIAWPDGASAVATQRLFDAPCQAIRVTAGVANGIFSIGD